MTNAVSDSRIRMGTITETEPALRIAIQLDITL